MADKTPIRLVLDGANNPTGLAEFQSGETIGVTAGGTGLSSLGTPGYFLRTNGAGNALEYAQVVSSFTIRDDSSTTDTVNTGETLSILGLDGITTSVTNNTISIDLDDTAVTPNTYGSSTAIPVLTIDQQGRITSASTQNISTTLTISDDTSSLATINLGSDTLKISGTSNEIETSISGDTITIGLPDNVTIAGNLTVSGTTTTINTTNTTVTDKLLELATGTTGSPTGDAGIIIERGDQNNIFIGFDESADVVTFASGTFTGASTGDLTLTESNIKAADITSTGNLDVTGSSTLRGNITLGVNSGDSTEDSITVNARFVSNLEPLHNITYDLGSPNRRWRDIYLSGNTIDLNGATISGDGSGNITISAGGAVLPEGSQVGNQSIATADPDTGISTRFVPLFTQTSGLATAAVNLIFKSGNETGQLVFTDFIVSNGQNVATFNSGGTLFAF